MDHVRSRDETLPRKSRITCSSDYEEVFRSGRKAFKGKIGLVVARNRGRGTRVGISVSKRVGNAVIRNRIKRYVREYFRINKNDFQDNIDLVFLVISSIGRKVDKELWTVLQELSAKLDIKKKRTRYE